ASHSSVAFASMVSNTGASSPGEPEMTFSTSDVAACRSKASERCPRASASSRVRASSCFFNSISELGPLLTRVLAFVLVERSLRPRVGLFAPLRDKVTSLAQPLVPLPGRPSQGSSPSILTEPHAELAPFHTRSPRRPLFAERALRNIWPASRGSLRLDVGRPDHLAPLLGLVGNEPAEVGGRAREHRVAQLGDARPDLGIIEASIDLAVELVD